DRGCGPASVLLLDRAGFVSGDAGAHPVVGTDSAARVGDRCRGRVVDPDPVQLAAATGRSEPRCARIGLDLVDSLSGRLGDGWGAAWGAPRAWGGGSCCRGGDGADGADDVAVEESGGCGMAAGLVPGELLRPDRGSACLPGVPARSGGLSQ